MKRTARKPGLILMQGGAPRRDEPAKPAPYNPGEIGAGEHDDLTCDEPEEKNPRGLFEDHGRFAGTRRFTIYGASGELLRVIEEPAHRLHSRAREKEVYAELLEWLNREDPVVEAAALRVMR